MKELSSAMMILSRIWDERMHGKKHGDVRSANYVKVARDMSRSIDLPR